MTIPESWSKNLFFQEPLNVLLDISFFLQGLQFGKCFPSLLGALPDQQQRNDDPEGVAKEVICEEIESLGSAVTCELHPVVKGTGGVVEDITVELAEADDYLQWVAEGVVGRDEVSADEGERPPERRSNGLHAGHERVLGKVAGVG